MSSFGDGFSWRGVGLCVGLGLGMAASFSACGGTRSSESDCMVGSINCECTAGGGCDPGLVCMDEMCVNEAGDSTDGPTSATNPTASSTADGTAGDSMDTEDLILDVGDQDLPGGACVETGCKQVDMLFALDSSLSMSEEINELRAAAAFAQVVQALSELNCGDIDYRIGLTNDNDGGWISAIADPWLDSQELTVDNITVAFEQAAGTVLNSGGTDFGCEHVLSTAADLLASDSTGFLRDDALLVLVLITDVDDYGYYDQADWPDCQAGICPCSMLCTTQGAEVADIYSNLVGLKGGDENGVSTIVVAGDPTVMEGMNLCGQPATCCGIGLECGQAHHAPRLYDFADMQAGNNGVAADICAGAEMVPTLIQEALENDIDLACQTFEPEG